GRGRQRRLGGQTGGGVTVDQAGGRMEERREGRAGGLVQAVGGDGQGHRVHGQRAGHIADRVVAVDRARGGDAVRVAAHVAAGRGRGRQGRLGGQTGGGVTVDQAGGRIGQRRQGSAVVLVQAVGGDGQGHRVHRQRAGHVADGVVAVDRATGRDAVRVAAHVAAG